MVTNLLIIGCLSAGNSISSAFCFVARGLDPQGSGRCSFYIADKFANLSNWQSIGTKNWSLVNGQLVMQSGDRMFDKTILPDNYKISVNKATLLSGNGYGIYFRMTPSGTDYSGYDFQVDPGLGNKFVFRRYDTNGAELSAPLASANMPANFDLNAPHQVDVVVQGSTYQAYVDGTLVLTASDSNYKTGGQAGFRTWDSSVAKYDNFTVTPP